MGIFLKDINLKGKTALITGATKGLGRGAAKAIAQVGGNIIAVGRNQSELKSLGKELKKFRVNHPHFNQNNIEIIEVLNDLSLRIKLQGRYENIFFGELR